VIEIDTTGGPRFGAQYRGDHLLQSGEIVLTFDDGPHPAYTKPILVALAAHCTRATFFNVGRMASAYPDMVKAVASQGHTIGTHTWSHANLKIISEVKAKSEVESAFSSEQRVLNGPVAAFFRFPYLSDSRAMVAYLGMRNVAVFSIDVDSKDYLAKTPEDVRRHVMSGLSEYGKGIILFHDIQRMTARALPAILNELKAKGYRVVHLTSKAPFQTLAAYDRKAGETQNNRENIVNRNGLASRSIVWPMTVTPPAFADPARARGGNPSSEYPSITEPPWITDLARGAHGR
jgi:peptidoglycan/xylan/chitin deacetylase (PgdA/CDA1 family)